MSGLRKGSVAVVGAAESDLGLVAPNTSPVDLMAQGTMRALEDGLWVYRSYFLRRWRRSLLAKAACFPELYDFGDVPHSSADIEMANYYTATHPSSVFRRTFTMQRLLPGDRVILRTTMITRYRNGVRTDTPIDPKQVRRHARELFGIDLGDEPLLFESLTSS